MKCSKCKKPTEFGAFATFRTRLGELRRRGVCKECRGQHALDNFEYLQKWRKQYNESTKTERSIRGKARRAEARAYVDKFKSVPCTDCGVAWPPVAMDLDHVRGAKIKNVASFVGSAYKLELIKEELEKCEVVCACCHRLRTHAKGQNLAPTNMLLPERTRTNRS